MEVEMGVLQGLISNPTDGYLYAAWKGEPGDDRIFYSRWSGSGKWASGAPMASGTVSGNTSAGPSLGIFNHSVYAGWKGEWSDPRLFVAKFNGSSWEAQQQIPDAYSDEGPALCALGTQLIAAWKNVFDSSLYFASYNGTTWTAPSQISGVGSSVGPSLAIYGGKLYAIWKGEGSDQSLWYASYDGTKWSGQTPGSSQTQIPGVGSSVGASLASVGNNLYAVWKGEGSDESLWYAFYDGTKWSGQTPGSSQTQIPGVGSSIGAAVAEFSGNLYAMCKGKDSDPSLYNAEFKNNSWPAGGWATDIPGNTGPDSVAAPVAFPQQNASTGGNNYWLADSAGKGAVLTGTNVTIMVVDDIVPDSPDSAGAKPGNYSFQINCNGPVPAAQADSFVGQQFGYRIAAGQLFFWVNCFRQQDVGGGAYLNWDSRQLGMTTGWTAVTNNRLPSRWQLTTTLVTDHGGNVTGFSFTVAKPDGTLAIKSPSLELLTVKNVNKIVQGNLAPIVCFQAVMVGENAGETCNFSAGKGIFLCYANNNISASQGFPSNSFTAHTVEKSNVTYSPLPASYPNGEFYQQFGVGGI
jgi:hypothetical protein